MKKGRSAGLSAGLLAVALMGCPSDPPPASAVRIESREQLIGGRRALGDVGDFKLSNGVIQAIVQDVGHSRGFGAFGGSLIDVDLVRGARRSASTGGAGNDYFTEMFPAFFLEAIEPEKVEVLADGKDGREAVIRVSGRGGEFMSLTKSINELALGTTPLEYHVDYALEPGKSYLKITTTVTNTDPESPALFPLEVPFGLITLLGEGQRLFVPGKAGYDMRHRLDEVYKQKSSITALPGEVTSMITTEGSGVSYGLVADLKSATYLHGKEEYYPTAKRDSMLIPLASGSFLATFWAKPPGTLPPGKSFSYTGYFVVGGGDVASVQKVIYGLRETQTGTISGTVREVGSGQALTDVTVVFQDDQGDYVSSTRTTAGGLFTAPLPPGRYRAWALDSVRRPIASAAEVSAYTEVTAGSGARVDLTLERPGFLTVTVRDGSGQRVPAKVSVEAVYENPGSGPPRGFLYDLKLGERPRVSDLDPDVPGRPETQKFLETFFFAPSGTAGTALRPGQYKIYASRGIEYDLATAQVELGSGEQRQLSLVVNHVMPTPGYVSADFHVHSANSVDSDMALTDRVASYAAEGVDFIAATDHNYVSDFSPTVEAMGLQRWLKTSVGLELTTLEMGHFNAWPLKLEPGPVTHGAFDWFRRPPGVLFGQLRSLGRSGPEDVIVQVNHPRDSIMGYFTAFNLGAYTGTPLPPSGSLHLDQEPLPGESVSPYHPSQFSLDFDVLEVFNGKHQEQLHHYRIPAVPPDGPEPSEPIPAPGEVLEELVQVPESPGMTCPPACKDQAQPVYPGALDDYYLLVSRGHQLTAVGNSDSHSAKAEAGLPRTYLRVGDVADGPMRALPEQAVIDALKGQRAIVTNGPFVEVWVNDQPIGSRVVSPDGTARVKLRVQAASWVDVAQVVIKRGGPGQLKQAEVLKTYGREAMTEGLVRFEAEETFTVADGSFLVVEVSGERSMWPVFTPLEVPSLQLTDAVATIGGAFGFGNKYGKYQPEEMKQITPFAFTNPIWVDRTLKQPLEASRKALPLGPTAPRKPARIGDLRTLFGTLHGE